MSGVSLPLAHAGEGATWQALLTLLALGLAAVFVLVAVRLLALDEPGDLILPLAGTAVLASLSGATSTVLSDWVGWAFPLGVVVLVALVLAASTPLDLTVTSPLALVSVVLVVVGIVVFQDPIRRAWHPTVEAIVAAPLDDLAIEIVEPADGTTVDAGPVDVVVGATGGSLGNGFDDRAVGSDPEHQVALTITTVSGATGQSTAVQGVPDGDCSEGCRQATYTVELAEPGTWTIFVEAKTADARPFAPTRDATGSTTDRVEVEVS